jgi:transcriptional regulator with XRE-family HTH domain
VLKGGVVADKFSEMWDLKTKRRVECLFDQGASIQEVARDMGISRSTFYKWMNGKDKRKEEFRKIVSIGKEAAEAWWIRQGRENLDNKGFVYGLWLINMQNRFNWTSSHSRKEEKKEIEHTGVVEVKKKVDVEAILEKAIKRGVEDLGKIVH